MAVELRIALLVIGLIILVALYSFEKSRRVMRRREDQEFDFEADELPDLLEADENPELDTDQKIQEELNSLSNLVREDVEEFPGTHKPDFKHQPSLLGQGHAEVKQEEKLVVLHVMARLPKKFNGNDIVTFIRELDLEYGNRIFHKNVERLGDKKALYSIVNIVKPGTFDLDTIDKFTTPGLSFIMCLPGPEEGLKAFNIMLEAAKKSAERLNGRLLDASRNQLSSQTIAHMQEDIQLFSLKYSRRA